MEEKGIVYINECFDITGIGIVMEIMHFQNGLPKSTILTSKETGLTWSIVSRVLFDHAVDRQKVFNNESIDYLRLNFQSIEKMEHSIQQVIEKEKKGIFQYLVKPINHKSKPLDDEELVIGETST